MGRFVILLFVFILAACNEGEASTAAMNSSPSAKQLRANEKTVFPDFSQVMKLNLEEAVAAYGPPPHRIRTKLDDLMGEFYVGLEAAFTQAERDSGEVRIHELTWEKDSVNLITVWYHEQSQESVPVNHLVYDREAEF